MRIHRLPKPIEFLDVSICDDTTFHFDFEPPPIGDPLSQPHTTEYDFAVEQ